MSLGETFDLLSRHERRNVEQRLRNLPKVLVAEFRLLLKDASFLGCLRLSLPMSSLAWALLVLGFTNLVCEKPVRSVTTVFCDCLCPFFSSSIFLFKDNL